jgi:hypothetical protein
MEVNSQCHVPAAKPMFSHTRQLCFFYKMVVKATCSYLVWTKVLNFCLIIMYFFFSHYC